MQWGRLSAGPTGQSGGVELNVRSRSLFLKRARMQRTDTVMNKKMSALAQALILLAAGVGRAAAQSDAANGTAMPPRMARRGGTVAFKVIDYDAARQRLL